MRILVAGTGFTGSRILTALRRSGHEVIGLNRSGGGDGVMAGDVLAPESLDGLKTLPPFDLLISTLSGSGQRDPACYRSIYVDGPRRILDRMAWRNAPQVWMLGSTGVYGVGDGSWVNETTLTEPVHRTGQVQVDAEQALQAACDQTCVLRLSGLYGPGRTRLIRQALRKRPFLKPDLWANQIHADDVAALVQFLVDREAPPPPLLLVSDEQPTQRKEIFTWIRKEMNLPDGRYDEDHPGRAGADRGNKRVDSSKMRALGFRLKYPGFREGLGSLLADLNL